MIKKIFFFIGGALLLWGCGADACSGVNITPPSKRIKNITFFDAQRGNAIEYKIAIRYDDAGEIKRITTMYPGRSNRNSKRVFEWEKGLINAKEYFKFESNTWTLKQREHYCHDHMGRVIEKRTLNGEMKNLLREKYEYATAPAISHRRDYFYNKDRWMQNYSRLSQRKWDDLGNETESIEFTGDSTVQSLKKKEKTTTQYKEGRLTSTSSYAWERDRWVHRDSVVIDYDGRGFVKRIRMAVSSGILEIKFQNSMNKEIISQSIITILQNETVTGHYLMAIESEGKSPSVSAWKFMKDVTQSPFYSFIK